MTDPAGPDASLGGHIGPEPRATWSPWEAIPVFLISVIAAGILSLPFLSTHPNTRQQLGAGIVAEVALGGTVVAWLYTLHRRSMRALGPPERPLLEIAVGLAGGLLLVGVLVYGFGSILARILEAVSGRHHVGVPSQLPGGIHGAAGWLAAILVIGAAPVCEELFFRGLVFRGLRRRHGFAASAAISGVVFGLAHLQEAIPGPWQGAALLVGVLTLVGVGLALIYERRGNLAAPIAAHAAFNLIGLLVILNVLS
jgi:membrane protease YdiL (CAAX protease family)